MENRKTAVKVENGKIIAIHSSCGGMRARSSMSKKDVDAAYKAAKAALSKLDDNSNNEEGEE
jgi:hypothetical protein